MAPRKPQRPLAVHAPGPWQRSNSGSVVDRDGIVVRFTAKFQDVGASGESDRAPLNDKLAITAPELADLLKAAIDEHVEDGCCGPKSDDAAAGFGSWCDQCVAFRAALRKAGRKP